MSVIDNEIKVNDVHVPERTFRSVNHLQPVDLGIHVKSRVLHNDMFLTACQKANLV